MDPNAQPPTAEAHSAAHTTQDDSQHSAQSETAAQSDKPSINGAQNTSNEVVRRTARLVVEEIRPKYSLPQEDEDDGDASEGDKEAEAEAVETGDLLVDYPSDAEVRIYHRLGLLIRLM